MWGLATAAPALAALDGGRSGAPAEATELGSLAVEPDTDRDGLADAYELRYGLAAAWPAGVVGAWPMEELGAGGQVADLGPYARHGTAVVAPQVIAGPWDNAFSFAQGAERVSVTLPAETVEPMRGRFAFSLWLRIAELESNNRLVLSIGPFAVNSPWLLRTEFNGAIALIAQGRNAAGQAAIVRAALPGALPVGEWVWIGGACDGKQLWLASDGNETTARVDAGFQPLAVPSDPTLFIGATPSQPTLGCRADIDHLALFSQAHPRSVLRAVHEAVLDLDGDGLTTREEAALDPALDPTRADTDGDGLDDGREVQLGTDPLDSDTDGDEMPDGWEVAAGFDPNAAGDGVLDADADQLINREEHRLSTDPRDPDSDDDGLDDGPELQVGTDPLDADTDGDQMPDGWEVAHATDPLAPDAEADPDGDGLANGQEYDYRADPHDPDSDDDGLSDGDEVRLHGTAPSRSDSDRDSMPDPWEIEHGLNAGVPPELVGWWAFDQADALGRFEDLAGLNGPARPVGGPVSVPGWMGQAVEFDGSGAHMRVDDTAGLDGIRTDLTISLWCRLAEDAKVNRFILSRGEPGSAPYEVSARHYRAIGTTVRIAGAAQSVSLPPEIGAPAVGEWAWVVVTRCGSTLRLYVDGALVAARDTLPDLALDPPATPELLLGGGFLFSPSFLGAIDEVRLLSRCYAPDELPWIHDAHLDPDDDDLTNAEEYAIGSDPHDPDTDDDGLTDGFEARVSLTRPLDPDTDDDGLPDGWERDNDLDPLRQDASDDTDGDGLANHAEYDNGTDPQLHDTDSDLLTDAAEVLVCGTDPLREDGDGDGLPDPWESARPGRADPRWNPLSDSSLLGHCTFDRVGHGHGYVDRVTGWTMVVGDPALEPRLRPGRLAQAVLTAPPWPSLVILPRAGGTRLPAGGWTIGLWLYAEEALPAGTVPVLTMAAAAPLRIELFIDGTGLPRARWTAGSSSGLTPAPVGVPAIAPEQWRHLALRFDGGALSLAVDAQLRPETAVALSPAEPFPDTGWLGGAPGRAVWPGRIDDLRFYGVAATQAQLTEAFGGTAPVCEWLATGPGGGGFIQSARAAAASPGRIFAGSDVGGFFVTRDGGRVWAPVTAGLGSYYVQDILPDSRDPVSAWVATGGGLYHYDGAARRHSLVHALPAEPIACLGAAPPAPGRAAATLYAAVGDQRQLLAPPPADVAGMVYRSSDGGVAWTAAGRVPGATHVRAVEVDPRNPLSIFTASDTGVHLSVDGGASWTAANSGIARPDLASGLAVDWGAAPAASRLWLATGLETDAASDPAPSQLYRSTDGGATWALAMDGLPAFDPAGSNPNYRSVRTTASSPDTLLLGNLQDRAYGLYSSADGADSWASVDATAQFAPGEQGYRSSLAVAWDVDMSRYPTLLAATWTVVLQSDDAGMTWRNLVSRSVANGAAVTYRTRGVDPTIISAIQPDPDDPNRLFVGVVDIGLLQSDDAGLTFHSAAIDKSVRARVQDLFAIVVDPDDPNLWYAAFGAGAAGEEGGVLYSVDHTASWQPVPGSLPRAWVTSLLLRPGGGTLASRVLYATLYLGSGSRPTDAGHGWRVYRSDDGGGAWTDVSAALAQLPATATILGFIPDPDDLDDGALVIVRDGLTTGSANGLYRWTPGAWVPVYSHPQAGANNAATVPGPFEHIAVDAEAPRHFFAGTLERGLYESVDGGASWQRLYSLSAPHLAVSDTLYRRGAPDRMFLLVGNRLRDRQRVGESKGVVVLERTGGGAWQEASFSPVNAGLGMLDGLHLVADPHRPGRLYLGTHGQGLYIGTERSPETQPPRASWGLR